MVAEMLQKIRIWQNKMNENQEASTIKAPVAPRPPDSVRYANLGHLPRFVAQGRCKFCKKGFSAF